ncbi:MAG: dephospho-CoA kinase [Gammaproteobacteria bacterium]|nr:dephospho-CoA kinase [Gammaproteobacteria bacterium]MBU2056942.1 dephospho-CoA kinase [Gammaproteobacteria bacterium]MBU2174526.1 dephospho-CoA kinase [Gammaproteobacteria bacterium]MBU2248218.1 dephospho-CoA kinase [Gammaproteobacteria bacterium]MBU2343777.1 dephospho-CoA kinase [Gammaproteobacteria bacterium]
MSGYIVGLTGGIGSGKTTVANLFHELAVQSVDADLVARDVVMPGEAALIAITEHFGQSILQQDGQLDRAALRARIFADETEKQWLNQLLHPLIRQRLLQQLAACTSDYALLIAPLLLENKLQTYTDRVLVVDVPQELQLSRTMQRDQVPAEQVQSILNSQITRSERLQLADDVLLNTVPLSQLQAQILHLNQRYQQFAKEKLAKSST